MPKVAAKPADSGHESQDVRTRLLAQKTELIGQLAEGMANQFNNVMMAVTSYADLELKKAGPAGSRSLEQIVSNTSRAASLVQKLLAFTRKSVSFVRPLDLNGVIADLEVLLQQLVGEEVEVVLSLDPAVQKVQADQLEIEQLLLSLSMNARNEMSRGGRLAVATRLVTKSEGDNPESFALLSVAGSARGSQSQACDLHLTEERQVERDYNLRVYLPVLENGPEEAQESSTTVTSSPSAKTILVVEDDDAVRLPAADFLKMEGFKVLQARTGTEAMRIAQRNRSSLDLLITDLVMPEMSGREVAEKLLETHPHLKVLYMSGDANEAAASHLTGEPQNAVLQKPFRLNKLNDKIRDLLGS